METLSTIIIVYGVFCIVVGLLKPGFLWGSAKFKALKKMMGSDSKLQLLIIGWGIACAVVGVLI